MAKGEKPSYEVFVSQPGQNGGKPFYTKVGAAWNVASDGISIKLIPGISVSDSVVLFPVKSE